LTLRTKLSLVLCALLALSIGATGAILIYESARHVRAELFAKHQLLAENRAFALRDNFEILENELERLAHLPQIDFTDNDPLPEAQLLTGAHQNSVLYNTAVLLLSADGECTRSVPDQSIYRQRRFGERSWFMAARHDPTGIQFHLSDEPEVGRTLKIVQPISRAGKFAGALVGVITLAQENLITPTMRENLPPATEAVLLDFDTGRLIYPADGLEPFLSRAWDSVLQATRRGKSGTLRARVAGEDSLFAFAPIGAHTRYAVVFRWPWASLFADVRQQALSLFGTLMVGVFFAALAGIALSTYLTGPLKGLGATARRIAQGDYPHAGEFPRAGRSDEIGALVQAFEHMGSSIQLRDRELQSAAALLEQRVTERTRELAEAQQALVEAERFAAMGKTSAAIAHELKNAMGGLGMAVDLILADPGNVARASRLRTQIVSEIARLRDVIDSLLSFSRAPRLERTESDLAEIARRAIQLLGDVIADRGADVQVEVEPQVLCFCDGAKIQSVVMNLVRNAAEAGHRALLRAACDGNGAWIEVHDDGPGLSSDARQHLFEPFFTTKPNGTGLGLPTSRRFVEAHGGSIEASTSPALGGARFVVRLPGART
jgi:signal transduction histidine kinase